MSASNTSTSGDDAGSDLLDINPNLEGLIIPRFDELVSNGEVLWVPYESETFEYEGFKAIFQLCPHLMKKPIQHADAPERKTGRGANPFLNPDPSFVLTTVGPSHTMMLNKYPVYRPSVILFTNAFVPQSDDLTHSDLHAAWTVIQTMKRTPYMMIYNCGVHSGSSQGHKHMQLWPLLPSSETGFDLFPSQATSTETITSSIPNVPHTHFVLRLPDRITPTILFDIYTRLLAEITKCHKTRGSRGYNVVLTSEWMCLIPRRRSGAERYAGSNAAGVLGLIWVTSVGEKEIWRDQPDLGEFLGWLGLPVEGGPGEGEDKGKRSSL